MSWYTQNLLKDSLRIHENPDLDSDEYNDLILLEKKIEQLHDIGIISDDELGIINYLKGGNLSSDAKKLLGKERKTVSRKINDVCNKVAFYLGSYFTDEGYVNYMKNKYNLSNEQLNIMIDYMRNKFKYRVMRKTNNANK